jgi:hypothetical protein
MGTMSCDVMEEVRPVVRLAPLAIAWDKKSTGEAALGMAGVISGGEDGLAPEEGEPARGHAVMPRQQMAQWLRRARQRLGQHPYHREDKYLH